MSTYLRAGLVGCGSLSQRGVLPHLSTSDARERIRLVAVVDALEERARQSAARFDVPAYFTSVEAMLATAEVDIVLVITPIAQHFAHAMAALEAGKHVYVQKAMTTTLAEADQLLMARDRAGVKLAAAPGFDLFPTTQQMRQIVTDGTLGRVAVAYTYTMGFGHEHEPIRAGTGALAAIDPSWYYRAGAGPLPDVTVYALQLATSVLGPVRRVTALSNTITPQRTWHDRTITIEVPDNNVVLLEFETGTLGVAVGSDCRGSARIPWGGMGLYGTTGTLEITEVDQNSGYPLRFELQGGASGRPSSELSVALADQPFLKGEHLAIEEPHVYVDIMDLVEAIQEDRPPCATGEQARHVVEIIERARIAARTGQAQELSSSFMPASTTVDGA
jgi:predicted dehydrogenase